MSALEDGFRLLPQRVGKLEDDTLGLADKLDMAVSDAKEVPGKLLSLNDSISRLEGKLKTMKEEESKLKLQLQSEVSKSKDEAKGLVNQLNLDLKAL